MQVFLLCIRLQQMVAPPWSWFLLPVKREYFLPTVAKRLVIGGLSDCCCFFLNIILYFVGQLLYYIKGLEVTVVVNWCHKVSATWPSPQVPSLTLRYSLFQRVNRACLQRREGVPESRLRPLAVLTTSNCASPNVQLTLTHDAFPGCW